MLVRKANATEEKLNEVVIISPT